jgi:Fe2+ transport system protein B
MLIERIIFLYNPFDREKELKAQKEIDDAQKEESFEPILDLKKLNSIEETKNEEEEHKKAEENNNLLKSQTLNPLKNEQKLEDHEHSLAKKVVKENIFKYPIFFKFVFQVFLLIAVGYFVFIFMPTNGTNKFYPVKHNLDGSLFLIKGNGYLMAFYFLYCLYFLASSYQIKYEFEFSNK